MEYCALGNFNLMARAFHRQFVAFDIDNFIFLSVAHAKLIEIVIFHMHFFNFPFFKSS